jgi:hypothetical protein
MTPLQKKLAEEILRNSIDRDKQTDLLYRYSQDVIQEVAEQVKDIIKKDVVTGCAK